MKNKVFVTAALLFSLVSCSGNNSYKGHVNNSNGIIEEHKGGIATKDSRPICNICGEEYGSKLEYHFEDGMEYSRKEIIEILSSPAAGILIKEDFSALHVPFTYKSTSSGNKVVTLSGSLVLPLCNGNLNIKGLIINSHPTLIDRREAPSECFNIFNFVAATECATINCDLEGLGSSLESPTCFHCKHFTAINTIDGVLACMDYLENFYKVNVSDLPIFNLGYSQGGYSSLAVANYLEVYACKDLKERIKITKNYCGAGAYDMEILFDDMLSKSDFVYPEYLAMGLLSLYYYHPEAFKDYKIEDFFTPNGIKVAEALSHKSQAEIDDLKLETDENGNYICATIKDIYSEELLSPDSEMRKFSLNIMQYENLFSGWTPKNEYYFYYYINDDVVSSKCSLKLKETFGDLENVTFEEVTYSGNESPHKAGGISFYFSVYLNIINLLN